MGALLFEVFQIQRAKLEGRAWTEQFCARDKGEKEEEGLGVPPLLLGAHMVALSPRTDLSAL